MRIEKVMRFITLPCTRQAHHIAQHVRKAIARICTIHAALHFKIKEQATVADEDGEVLHRAFFLICA